MAAPDQRVAPRTKRQKSGVSVEHLSSARQLAPAVPRRHVIGEHVDEAADNVTAVHGPGSPRGGVETPSRGCGRVDGRRQLDEGVIGWSEPGQAGALVGEGGEEVASAVPTAAPR